PPPRSPPSRCSPRGPPPGAPDARRLRTVLPSRGLSLVSWAWRRGPDVPAPFFRPGPGWAGSRPGSVGDGQARQFTVAGRRHIWVGAVEVDQPGHGAGRLDREG